MLHRFSTFVAACTVLLVLAGSLVTSTNSGLAVPDWPTTYGWNMFAFPPSKWVGGILYEHGHRLIASTVGFLTIVLTAWIWLTDSRRWLRWFGVGALFTSPGWMAGYDVADSGAGSGVEDSTLRRAATTVTIFIYAQILIGATMR